MKEQIKNYILENIVEDDIAIDNDQSLFEDGLIDSMGQVKLLSYLEQEFNIAIEPGEITLENFDTLNQIADFISKNLKK